VPGLVPGLLGAGLVVLGALLGLRAIRAGALAALVAPIAIEPVATRRLLLTGAVCIGYVALLLGRLPFWLATAIFVFVFVLLFEWERGQAWALRARRIAIAAALGLGTGWAVLYVFRDIFLVRLP